MADGEVMRTLKLCPSTMSDTESTLSVREVAVTNTFESGFTAVVSTTISVWSAVIVAASTEALEIPSGCAGGW
ncbi:MAG TPA: hypothetical protein VF303_01450 [Candidatus Nanoarchaeia archaeon]